MQAQALESFTKAKMQKRASAASLVTAAAILKAACYSNPVRSIEISKKRGLAPAIRRLHLRRPELTGSEIARRIGCTRQNVHQILHTFLDNHTEQELRDFQAKKADIFDFLQLKLLASITDEKIQKSSLRARVLCAAILEDKARLARQQATGINATALRDVAEAIRQQARRAGARPPGTNR